MTEELIAYSVGTAIRGLILGMFLYLADTRPDHRDTWLAVALSTVAFETTVSGVSTALGYALDSPVHAVVNILALVIVGLAVWWTGRRISTIRPTVHGDVLTVGDWWLRSTGWFERVISRAAGLDFTSDWKPWQALIRSVSAIIVTLALLSITLLVLLIPLVQWPNESQKRDRLPEATATPDSEGFPTPDPSPEVTATRNPDATATAMVEGSPTAVPTTTVTPTPNSVLPTLTSVPPLPTPTLAVPLSGELQVPSTSSHYEFILFTVPLTANGAEVSVTVSWADDWYPPPPDQHTSSFPHLVEVPYPGGFGCDFIRKYPVDNMVEFESGMDRNDQNATKTDSIVVGPGSTVAIVGSDCFFEDNFTFHRNILWSVVLF